MKRRSLRNLSDSETEAAETQVSLLFAESCGYIDSATRERLDAIYDTILAQLVNMVDNAPKWLIREAPHFPRRGSLKVTRTPKNSAAENRSVQ